MQLNKIQDDRSPLHKLTRKELEYLARKEGRTDVVTGMPADLMRLQFQAKPPSSFPRPMRGHLGSSNQLRIPSYDNWLRVAFGAAPQQEISEPEVQEVNAADDLRKQWEAQQSTGGGAFVQKPKVKNEITEVRQECKRRGIKMNRTDTMADLKAKLDG